MKKRDISGLILQNINILMKEMPQSKFWQNSLFKYFGDGKTFEWPNGIVKPAKSADEVISFEAFVQSLLDAAAGPPALGELPKYVKECNLSETQMIEEFSKTQSVAEAARRTSCGDTLRAEASALRGKLIGNNKYYPNVIASGCTMQSELLKMREKIWKEERMNHIKNNSGRSAAIKKLAATVGNRKQAVQQHREERLAKLEEGKEQFKVDDHYPEYWLFFVLCGKPAPVDNQKSIAFRW